MTDSRPCRSEEASPSSQARRGLRLVYEMIAEALVRIPDEQVLEDVASIAEGMGFDELSIQARKIDPPSARQRFYDRFFVPTSSVYVVLSECRMADAEITDGRIEYGPAADRRFDHVLALYGQAGFDPKLMKGDEVAIKHLAADSLASEIAFLAYLENAREQKEADPAVVDRFAYAFLKRHSAWIGRAADIMMNQDDDLYAKLVELAATAVQAHREMLENRKATA